MQTRRAKFTIRAISFIRMTLRSCLISDTGDEVLLLTNRSSEVSREKDLEPSDFEVSEELDLLDTSNILRGPTHQKWSNFDIFVL